MEMFESFVQTDGKRITIILDSIYKIMFYEKMGYKVIDEVHDAKRRLLTKK